MTWTRLDDGWTDWPVLAELPFDVRWHYLSLIQFCSRTGRYDGAVREPDARRCSDVPDPVAANAALVAAGLLAADPGGLRLPRIEEHIPPPHQRDESRKVQQREDTRRHRAHKAGDHSRCRPDRCAHATDAEGGAEVSPHVSAYPGTGQDGTGQDGEEHAREDSSPPATAPAGPALRPVRPAPDRLWEQVAAGYDR